VTVNGATQIQAVTPANAAGPSDVTVEDPGNVSAKLSGGFTYNSSSSGPPTISGISPNSGTPGTQVTIAGTNFVSGTTVAFGNTNASSTTFVSSTELTSSVPTLATGTYNVTVAVPEPASATLNNGFTVTANVNPLVVDVSGNHFVDGLGNAITLYGVGVRLHTPSCPPIPMTVAPMKSWSVNAARLMLSEDCWLGINGKSSMKAATVTFVQQLEAAGIYPIIELIYTGPGSCGGSSSNPMPNANSTAFWADVAQTFANDHAVLFNLFNEPQGSLTWSCWLNGGCSVTSSKNCGSSSYTAVGMQSLVDTIRAKATFQPIIVDCLNYASDCLSGFLTYKPNDPSGKIVADYHTYNAYGTVAATQANVNYVIGGDTPIILGEIGEYDCAHEYIDALMAAMDSYSPPISYNANSWYVADCGGFPSLITDYSGTPTAFGIGYKDHLAKIRAASAKRQ
jgi:hypothetical protein